VRIRAITPIRVGATELARRQRRYRRLSPAAIEVTLVDLEDGPDVPRALETEDDVRRSERLVVAEARRTSAEEFDVVLPDCVLDPGVGVGADTPVPLVGILSLTGLGQVLLEVDAGAVELRLDLVLAGFGEVFGRRFVNRFSGQAAAVPAGDGSHGARHAADHFRVANTFVEQRHDRHQEHQQQKQHQRRDQRLGLPAVDPLGVLEPLLQGGAGALVQGNGDSHDVLRESLIVQRRRTTSIV